MPEVYEEVTAVISSDVINGITAVGLDVLLTLNKYIRSAHAAFYQEKNKYTVTGSISEINSARQELEVMLMMMKLVTCPPKVHVAPSEFNLDDSSESVDFVEPLDSDGVSVICVPEETDCPRKVDPASPIASGRKVSSCEFSGASKHLINRRCVTLKRSSCHGLSMGLQNMSLGDSKNSSFRGNKNGSKKKTSKDGKNAKYSCEICSFKTKYNSNFQKHMLVHENRKSKNVNLENGKSLKIVPELKKQYDCEFCDFKTSKKDDLTRHLAIGHEREWSFLCHLCGKTFKKACTFQQHHLTHKQLKDTSSKTYKCDICHKSFHSDFKLLEHEMVHHGRKFYACEVCGATFKTRILFRQHMIFVHDYSRSFSCKLHNKFNAIFRKHHSKVQKKFKTPEPKGDPTDVLAEKLKQIAMVTFEDISTEHSSTAGSTGNHEANSQETQQPLVIPPKDLIPASVPMPQDIPQDMPQDLPQQSEIPTTSASST